MAMNRFTKLFGSTIGCRIIGMVHVNPLPGTPLYQGNIQHIVDKACKEADIYLTAGIDSILVENMHDIPYIRARDGSPEIVAMMARICTQVKQIVGDTVPLGLQILAGNNKEALAVAKAANFDYIRAEGFIFAHIADEGFIDACAGELLRYRKHIDADNIAIFTDIKKKHSSNFITKDISLTETASAAEFFLSDGIILTGTTTGSPASTTELNDLKTVCKGPIIIGSGVTADNFHYYSNANACIIGSYFKQGGHWANEIENGQIRKLLKAANKNKLVA